MPDLETQLRNYARVLDESYPDVGVVEIIESDTPVVTLSRIPMRLPGHRPLVGIASVSVLAALLIVGVVLITSRVRPIASNPPELVDLGVFEPIRGRILFSSSNEGSSPLRVVDPNSSESVREFEFDFPLDVPLIPTGWSADGSSLAITDEYHGDSYVMDQNGRLKKVPAKSGCCSFAFSNWLSPDGAHWASTFPQEAGIPAHIGVLDFGSPPSKKVYEMEPFEWTVGPVWSPDSSQLAVASYRNAGNHQEPTLHIVDLESGAVRDLLGSRFGHIRNLAWSPDGNQILVIAGEFKNTVAPPSLNPYVNPIVTSIYLVNPDGSGLREIADGHYVTAAWSPDGSQIATIDYSGRREVTVVSADGSDERIVAALPASELFSGLAWHPVP